MLTELHKRHEIHYVAFANPAEPEGPQRAGEYSTQAYPVTHQVPSRRSAAFAVQARCSNLSQFWIGGADLRLTIEDWRPLLILVHALLT